MKQYDVKIDETDLSCTICLNSFYQPITIKCGHTFCFTCINDCRPTKNNNNFIPDTGITSNTMITRNVDGSNVSNSINNCTQWESNEANTQTQFDSTFENSCEV